MSTQPLYPDLDELLQAIGEAGARLSEIEACEGAAGNISVFAAWPLEPRRKFPLEETLTLPTIVPELAGGTLIVTGSGRRLREIIQDPTAHLGVLHINQGGRTAQLYTSPCRLFQRLTSELNSHLAVHADHVRLTGTDFHAVVHAQPPHLTYLSHIQRYQDELTLNRHILRWQPEMIINLPEGLGVVPFHVPGSDELMQGTLEALRHHRVVLWAKHGLMARSEQSVKRAVDRIEYCETGAHYEYLNLVNHEAAQGLTPEEICQICLAFGVQQEIF